MFRTLSISSQRAARFDFLLDGGGTFINRRIVSSNFESADTRLAAGMKIIIATSRPLRTLLHWRHIFARHTNRPKSDATRFEHRETRAAIVRSPSVVLR
jgi:hypothetical protein